MNSSDIGGNVEHLDIKKTAIAKNVRVIKAAYDTFREWKQDNIGYWLFRVNMKKNCIEAGFCKKENIIEVMVTGTDSEEMHNTIVREGLVKSLQHAAYIGHELMKAEAALKLGIPYIQDAPLNLDGIK